MPADPKRVRDVFLSAAEVPPADRPAYLDRACGADAELRAAVGRLLAAHDDPDGRLEPSAAPPTGDHTPRADAGTVLAGRYKLVEPIGEGGMGEVWMAEQTEPVRRRVAVKLIKPGMDSKAVLARFEAERQALALMDHPNIAKVLDAGASADGRPFFVMELVKGVPITRFCDDRRLTPRQRLELFVPVCQAVQHAHQKGVIHRDLKPSNVLVALYDDRPVPKVIDFGVAKATGQPLTEHTLVTGFGTVVGTPEYMSPEQATFNNLDVDTRSDVYALGVLLYELLTGSPPFTRKELESAGLLEIFRVIREREPPRPSTRLSTAEALPTLAANRGTEPRALTGLLRSELDWVAMKALEKDRTRRYETVNALAADVQRHLAGEPVQAVPPSAGYRLRKFVRRHKGRVIAAGVLALALIGAAGGAVYGLAERQNQREANALRAEAESARDRTALALGEAERARGGEKQARAEAERDREVLAHFEYGRTMQVAHQEWRDGNIEAMRTLLDGTDPRLRNWEWRYLNRLEDPSLLTFRGHTGEVRAVAFSPDGKRAVTGSRDNTAKVWDAKTGAELLTFRRHVPDKNSGNGVWSVAFCPDGTRVATSGGDRTARVWDAKTGAEVLALTGYEGSVAFSPDGALVVSGGDAATIWNAKTGTHVRTLGGQKQSVWSVAFSPDGARVVTGFQDGTAKIWEIPSAKPEGFAKTGAEAVTLKGHTETVSAAAFSPDGTRVVTGSHDQTVKIWDAKTGAELLTFSEHRNAGGEHWVLGVTFSPDGTQVMSTAEVIGAKVWDAKTGAEVLPLKKDKGWAAFSPDGTRVASGWGPVQVWDAKTGAEYFAFGAAGHAVSSVAFSPDGTRVLTSGHHTPKVWDARTGSEVFTFRGDVHRLTAAAFSTDGTRAVTKDLDGPVRVWDTRTGAEVLAIKQPEDDVGREGDVAFSPDGTRVLVAGRNGLAKVWNAESGVEVLTLKGHTAAVNSASFSPDGTRVVTGSRDGTARVWDAKTGKEILTLKGQTSGVSIVTTNPDGTHGRYDMSGEQAAIVNVVAFSPDGTRVLTGGNDGTAREWDAKTGKEILALKGPPPFRGFPPGLLVAAFSPDGTRMLVGGFNHAAKVWDAKTGAEVLTLKGPTGWAGAARFSPDGSRIVTGGDNNTVRVWDSNTGAEVLTLRVPNGVSAASFSGDGTRILVASPDGTVRVWDSRPFRDTRPPDPAHPIAPAPRERK